MIVESSFKKNFQLFLLRIFGGAQGLFDYFSVK